MGKVVDMFKQRHEKEDFYQKNATMQDIRAMAKLYEKVGGDVRKFNDIEKGDLEKKIIESHLETHGELLKGEHGFDYKHLDSLPDDKKIDIINTLYDTNINTIRDRIIQQGSDTDFDRILRENAQRKQERFISAVGNYFSKLKEDEQMELVKESILPAVGKDYIFNEGILKAQPEGVGQTLAQIYSGVDAKRAVRPLTYKGGKKEATNYKQAA